MEPHDREILFSNRFHTPHVGGQSQDERFAHRRFEEQREYLDSYADDPKSNNYYLEPEADNRYNPYHGYLYQQGLLHRERNTRFTRHRINVDSRHRTRKPVIDIDESYILENDPLTFVQESSEVFISIPDHRLEANQRITMTGVRGRTATLGVVYARKDGDTITRGQKLFEFREGSSLVRFNYPSRLDITKTNTTAQVEVIGIKGNIANTYLENIPLNQLNKIHTIILPKLDPGDTDDVQRQFLTEAELNFVDDAAGGDEYYVNGRRELLESLFFIELPINFIGSFVPRNYNIKLKFLSLCGIPLNQLNAEYPIDVNHLRGYHRITRTTSSGIYIDLDDTTAFVSGSEGGPAVEVSAIDRISSGYETPQSYQVTLGRSYYNVVRACLISSEFPNTEKVVKKIPSSRANNKLYWQNLDDGDHIYSIEIDPGNYDPDDLVDEMVSKFNAVSRITVSSDNEYISPHTQNHFIQVTINTKSDKVTFRSYRESILSKPIVDIFPDIQEDPNLDPDFDDLGITAFELTIEQMNHRLNVGDIVLIKSAIAHMGIPANVINSEHEIVEVVSLDRYKIRINRFNLATGRINSGGGVSVAIYTPNIFRLRFDYSDTIGSLLGFRNVGETAAITQYSTVISNQDLYELDTMLTNIGTERLTQNMVHLSGDNYILMKISQFITKSTALRDVGPVKEAFAKILLTDVPGRILYNTYVPIEHDFHEPITELSELEIEFFSPDGEPYNFNQVDHSFTLEIITRDEFPLESGISAQTGRLTTDVRHEYEQGARDHRIE